MRRLIFILLSIVLVTETSAKDLKVMGGLNLSRYSGTINGENVWKLRTGFAIGVGYEIAFSSHIAIEINGFYIQKGSREEYREGGRYNYTINYALNEISVPILLKIRLKADSSPYILAGGELSFILSHRYIVEEGLEIGIIRPDTKSAYYGLVFGCGFDWQIGSISSFIEARYLLSLTNIFEVEPPSYRPRAIAFLIGLKF